MLSSSYNDTFLPQILEDLYKINADRWNRSEKMGRCCGVFVDFLYLYALRVIIAARRVCDIPGG